MNTPIEWINIQAIAYVAGRGWRFCISRHDKITILVGVLVGYFDTNRGICTKKWYMTFCIGTGIEGVSRHMEAFKYGYPIRDAYVQNSRLITK